MKYLVFGFVATAGIPLMATAASFSGTARNWLISGIILSPALGDVANINFLSMETYRGPDRGFEINLTDLMVVAVAISFVVRHGHRVRWIPFNTTWLTLLFIFAAVTCAAAPAPLLGGFTLFKALKVYLLFWCFANILRVGVPTHAVWRGLVWTAILFASTTVYQKYGLGLYRTHALFDHSNTIPGYVNLVVPTLLFLGLAEPSLDRVRRAVTLLCVLGLAFAVVSTFSRAGIALTAALIISTLAIVNVRARSIRTTALSFAIAAIGGLGVLPATDSILDRIQNAPESSEHARDEFNVIANQMASEHGLGVGLNNFSLVLTETPRYRATKSVMADEEQGGVVHHIYWLTAAEMGYGGLALFLAVIGRFLWAGIVGGFRASSLSGSMLLCLALGAASLHLAGLLEWTLRITPVTYLFAIVCGLTVAWHEQALASLGRRRSRLGPAVPHPAEAHT